ncbi:hypothetical protein DYB32_004580 [Aphanomyces invadans]|uniref:Proteasome assembly chaperone 2 n=1 Tax=Aphanomyces invadans TaxID=157072 RepID=A0A418AX58_9STRA|nr:hypothetical protein DYB32_004580 [Aphanomyces invadans]
MLRHDVNMHERSIQWVSTDKLPVLNEPFLHQFPPLTVDEGDSLVDKQDVWSSVRGAGLAPKLITSSAAHSIPALAVLLHCAEGNNVPDAIHLASCIVQYLGLHNQIKSFRLVLPPSWAQLYGRDPAIALYA